MKAHLIGPLRNDHDWGQMRDLRDALRGRGWMVTSALGDDDRVDQDRAKGSKAYMDTSALKIIAADRIVVLDGAALDKTSANELALVRDLGLIEVSAREAKGLAEIVGRGDIAADVGEPEPVTPVSPPRLRIVE